MNKGFVVLLVALCLVNMTYAQTASRGLTVQKWDDDAGYNGSCTPNTSKWEF